MPKERYPLRLIMLVIASGLVAGAPARANFLANGDFETGHVGDIPGWTVGGNASSYGVAAAGAPLGDFPPFGSAVAIAHSGTGAAYYVGDQNTTFTLSQSVTLAAGTYQVGVYIGADNPMLPAFSEVATANDKIFVDNILISTNPFLFVVNDFMGELFASVSLIAGSHSFEFSFTNGGQYANAFSLDDAFVSPPAAPVPEPSSLALLGSAVLATLWFTRRRVARRGS